MRTVEQHYAEHLAAIYVWMTGGVEASLATGTSDLAGYLETPGLAIDLGAGFGMHAIPLARAGYRVLAIDSSPALLDVLQNHATGLNQLTCVCDDLRRFAAHLPPGNSADLIICMGDTLTHLPDEADLTSLAANVAAALRPGGRFLATFRDYTHLPQGEARFIPVRSDANRILMCFLEELPQHVCVHDILHELIDRQWQTRVSCYRKLRIVPDDAKRCFESMGLQARVEPAARRMVRLVAEKHP